MMSREDVLNGLKEVLSVIRPATDLAGVGYETELSRGLGLDSLSMLLLALATEEKFGMKFPDGEAMPTTVGEVCDAVLKALS